MKLLHVAAEVFPLVKTGGLADVVAALPAEQALQGADVRLLLPGLPAVLQGLASVQTIGEWGPCFGALRVRLLHGRLPGSGLSAYAIDAPYLYQREGSPYQDRGGQDWPDNLQRFALLGWVAAHLAAGDADLEWSPDIVHAHDWHAALACVYTAERGRTTAPHAAGTVFTVHNLAFQGLFALHAWPALGLSAHTLPPSIFEFHGQLSFMKAALNLADRVCTVSPTYAREIATPEQGCGLDGVIRSRGDGVAGILNGIDERIWNPATDPALAAHYDADSLSGKHQCRRAVQQELGLQIDDQALLVGVVSRLTHQKGLDLLVAALPELLPMGVQLAVQGSGEPALEAALRAAQRAHPGRVAVRIGYDEGRAHRLVAGVDLIAVPSRFEPCGLTQMHALRYGSLPLVRRVGGLSDTVFDDLGPLDASSTGFAFDEATPAALIQAFVRATAAQRDRPRWQRLMRRAMAQPADWAGPAKSYGAVYADVLRQRRVGGRSAHA